MVAAVELCIVQYLYKCKYLISQDLIDWYGNQRDPDYVPVTKNEVLLKIPSYVLWGLRHVSLPRDVEGWSNKPLWSLTVGGDFSAVDRSP